MRTPIDHEGRPIDFGRTAGDYDEHRPGFPASMFARLLRLGWIAPGMRAIDLGAGTGALALGLAANGLTVVALDPSRPLLEVARRRAEQARVVLDIREGTAEDTRADADSFDLVTAGQCWWWFDTDAAIAEIERISRAEGRLVIANFCYLPVIDTVADRTERLILQHNPGWTKAGESGVFESQVRDLDRHRFRDVESFSYVEPVMFTHEAWRGRMRACNGVGAALSADEVNAFDRELASMLASDFPGELVVPHRVFVVSGRV